MARTVPWWGGLCDQRPAIHRGRDYSPWILRRPRTEYPAAFFIPLNNEPLISPTGSILEEASLNWLDLIGRVETGADTGTMEAQMQVQLRQFLLSPLSKVEERDKPLVARQMLHSLMAATACK